MATREFQIGLNNQTEFRLTKITDHLCHGVWASPPPDRIEANSVASWHSRSGGDVPIFGSIATGTEGWVKYKVESERVVDNRARGGEIVYIYWDNPYQFGQTYAKGAMGDVVPDCDDPYGGRGSVFTQTSETDLQLGESTLQPYQGGGYQEDWSAFPATWAEGPVIVWALDDIRQFGSMGFYLRHDPSKVPQSHPIPDFTSGDKAETTIHPVTGAPSEAWLADWTYVPSRWSVPGITLRIRSAVDGTYQFIAEDKMGYGPSHMQRDNAAVVQGFSYPFAKEVVTFPPQLHMNTPAPVGGNPIRAAVHLPSAAVHLPGKDKEAVVAIRSYSDWLNRKQSAMTSVDRMYLDEHVAVEAYGEYLQNQLINYRLRYLRWDARGQVLLDLVLSRHDFIK
jgi:hypothetical protein